ncbi:MAG: transcription antitermination factor NusB [Candidatus Eisenbacteria bacterium]
MKQDVSISSLKRRARIAVVKTLYEMEMSSLEAEEARDRLRMTCKKPEVLEFAMKLVELTLEHLASIDDLIVQVAENWDIERMAAIDRNVLRLGTAEILYMDDVPEKVTINEAIEIAKKFSTENSGRFVNGILDKVARIKSDLRDNL